MARSAEDCALLLNAMAGHDPLDSTSSETATQDYSSRLDTGLDGLRIGVAREHFGPGRCEPGTGLVRQNDDDRARWSRGDRIFRLVG